MLLPQPIARLGLILGIGALACVGGSEARAQGVGADQPVAVVELFTSQGCSNCPPADAVLDQLSRQPGVVALSMSVDMWDYLGWRDTLASPKLSQRQRGYAKTLAKGKLYTPQMIVNGALHLKGGHREEVEQAIKGASLGAGPAATSARVRTEGKMVVIDVAAAKSEAPAQQATVWLALVQRSVTVTVRKGDNSGRTLAYTNVVRDLIPVGNWTGAALTVRLQQAALARSGADACTVIVQAGTEGLIAGASPITAC